MKRALDIVGSLCALALLGPLLVLAVVGIRLSSPGPVIYRQERIGRGGDIFTLFKLRSMHLGADQLGHSTRPGDPRIFPFGRILRKLAIDELPQLINVLRGEMSLVGPRPLVPAQLDLFTQEQWNARNAVRPGITGLAQMRLRSSGTRVQALELDLDYAQNATVLRDIGIILGTIAVMFGKDST